MPTITERVERTAEILDRKYPTWADKIDLDTLKMSDGCFCIAGQLDQHYGDRAEDDQPSFMRFAKRLFGRLGKRERDELFAGNRSPSSVAMEVLAFGTEGKRAWRQAVLKRRSA